MPDKQNKTRYEMQISVEMPEVDQEHLLHYLENIGYGVAGFNGLQSLTWTEIKAWQELTETPLTAWESETLMHLSRAYCSMSHSAKDASYPSPLADDLDLEAKRLISEKLDKALNFIDRG